jgi:CheY-like chemotaxis protein
MLTGAKVLLVGDHSSVQAEATALRDAGATVLEAQTAQVALLLLQTEQADLILSELALPDVDGFALIEAVRRLPQAETASIPAVALSDEATDAVRQRALVSGFQLHMLRAADPRGLALTLSGLRRLSASAAHEQTAP